MGPQGVVDNRRKSGYPRIMADPNQAHCYPVKVYFSEPDFRLIGQAANIAGLSLSSFLREYGKAAAREKVAGGKAGR